MYQCVMNGTDSSMSEILNEIKTTDHILAYQLGTPMTVISYLCSFFFVILLRTIKISQTQNIQKSVKDCFWLILQDEKISRFLAMALCLVKQQ